MKNILTLDEYCSANPDCTFNDYLRENGHQTLHTYLKVGVDVRHLRAALMADDVRILNDDYELNVHPLREDKDRINKSLNYHRDMHLDAERLPDWDKGKVGEYLLSIFPDMPNMRDERHLPPLVRSWVVGKSKLMIEKGISQNFSSNQFDSDSKVDHRDLVRSRAEQIARQICAREMNKPEHLRLKHFQIAREIMETPELWLKLTKKGGGQYTYSWIKSICARISRGEHPELFFDKNRK